MTVTRRWVPVEEWPTVLKDTPLEAVWPTFVPGSTRVLVVESAGRVIFAWTFSLVFHAEGLTKVGHVSVAENQAAWPLVLEGLHEAAEDAGVGAVWTGALNERVRNMIVSHRGKVIEADQYILPVPLSR